MVNRFLAVTLLLSFGAVGVLAGDIEEGAVTFMGRNLLGKTDVVARGEIKSVSRLPSGPAIATFEVEEILWGNARGEPPRIALLSVDPSSFPPVDVTCVYFLTRLSRGRYESVGRVDLSDRGGPSRLETLRLYLEIEGRQDAGERRAALHDLLMANLVSGDEFKIYSAARELAHFTAVSPESFDDADRERIRQKIATSRNRLLVELLQTALRNLGGAAALPAEEAADTTGSPALPAARPAVLPPPDSYRELEAAWQAGGLSRDERRFVIKAIATRHLAHSGPVLLDALADPDPEVRWIAAINLGEALVLEATAPLLRVLASEKDDRVIEAAIQSLGVLGAGSALKSIVGFADKPAFVRSVAFAAARIGGPDAGAFLDQLLATHAGPDEADKTIRDLVEFLRSRDFTRQEEMLDKIRRRRLRGG